MLSGKTDAPYDPVDDFPVGLFKNKEDYRKIYTNMKAIKKYRGDLKWKNNNQRFD